MKVNSTELRLGNKITMPFLGDVILDVIGIAVSSENKTFIQSRNGNDTFFELPEKYKPIPLTEEWLVKFGFSHISKNDYQSPYEFLIFDIKLLCFADIQGYDEERIFSPIEVKYVHQLQNLYFALTGEELEIK